MNDSLRRRLQALEDRARDATTGIVPVGFVTDAVGDVVAFTIPALGRTLEPDAFWALVDEWADVVFMPGEEVPDRPHEAWYAVEEEAALSVTWEDLQRENERARAVAEGRAEYGPGAMDEARERAMAADPDRAALAQEYSDTWGDAVEGFWDPMRERCERMAPPIRR